MRQSATIEEIFQNISTALPAVSGGERFFCYQDQMLTEFPKKIPVQQSIEANNQKILSYGLKELSPGVVISYSNSVIEKAFSFGGTSVETLLAFRMVFKGKLHQVYEDHYLETPHLPSCSFQLLRAGQKFAISMTGDPEAEIIGIYITIDKLIELLSAEEELLPRRLCQFRESSEKCDNGDFLVSKASTAAARSLLNGVANNLFSEIHAQSKGLELLYLLFDDWYASEQSQGKSQNRFKLTDTDRKNLEKLYQHICENFFHIQNLDELTKIGCLNRNKLHYGFKNTYGVTIKQLQTRLRMEWAKEQLALGELKVSEIADRLNYLEANSFSAAYRRFYGVAPTRSV